MPLHPALVHLPIALAVVMPLLSVWALLGSRREGYWKINAALQFALCAAIYAAMAAGEADAELVGSSPALKVPLEAHETWGERSFLFSVLCLVLSAVATRAGSGRSLRRWSAAAAQLALAGLILWSAHLGGSLVYEHGAAEARARALQGNAGSPEGRGPGPDRQR